MIIPLLNGVFVILPELLSRPIKYRVTGGDCLVPSVTWPSVIEPGLEGGARLPIDGRLATGDGADR